MKSKYNFIPKSVKKLLRKTVIYRNRAIRKADIVALNEVDIYLNEAPVLLLKKELAKKPRVAIIKDKETLNGYVNPKASWLRYERFCKNNNIPYGFYDVERSDWMQEAEKYDIFVCHTPSNPAFQEIIESKIYILEKIYEQALFSKLSRSLAI